MVIYWLVIVAVIMIAVCYLALEGFLSGLGLKDLSWELEKKREVVMWDLLLVFALSLGGFFLHLGWNNI